MEEECVKSWASDLNPTTAKNYVYYFLDFIEWAKDNGYWSKAEEMLEDYKRLSPEERFKHVNIIKRYLKDCGTSSVDKRLRWYAIKSFYECNRLQPPKPPRAEISKLFKPSQLESRRAIELKPLEIE